MALDIENNDDETYSLFETKSTFNLSENENYRKLLQSAQGNRPNSTRNIPMRIGTSIGFGTGMPVRPGSSFRPITSFRPGSTFRSGTGRPGTSTNGDVNRPMTAVRGAGYTSHGKKMFDPLNQAAQINQQNELKEETPEEKIHQLENKIMECIEQSIVSSCERKVRDGLDKAKDASSKERNLIRLQEQAGLSDSHNLDLTFAVLFNLAVQYTKNEMYTEALNTYQLITRNRMFSNSHRLKVNMGNIYYLQGHVHKAVKLWRMALDQAPASHARLRMRIMHNIGIAHVRTGRYSDAVGVLEYVLGEGRTSISSTVQLHRAALHLVLCHYALEDVARMRHAFRQMLEVPLIIDDEDKYRITSEDPEEALIVDAIKNDELHKYEQNLKKDAEYCVLTAAKLIAPVIEENFSSGYEWCVQAIKNSAFAHLAGDLEINKAVMFLKQNQIPEAIDTLKVFEKESKIATSAATNLSFIYFLQGDLDNAEKYADIVRSTDIYNANGHVNLGVCALVRNDLSKARKLFEQALDCDPSHAEALYNLGITLLKQNQPEDALGFFRRLGGALALLPEVLWQTAECLAASGDTEAAQECLQQLLGLVPTDSAVYSKLGDLYEREGDKQLARHSYNESHRHLPSDVSVCNWLGGHHVEMQTGERALRFFEKAAIVEPARAKWRVLAAGCKRRSGDPHGALSTLEKAKTHVPHDSAELLRTMAQLCSELGRHDDARQYQAELSRVEKARDVRDRLASATSGGRKSATSNSSIGSAGPRSSSSKRLTASGRMLAQQMSANRDSQESEDSVYGTATIDASYADPLGPMAARPRTSGFRNTEEDFGDEQIGDDLLPE